MKLGRQQDEDKVKQLILMAGAIRDNCLRQRFLEVVKRLESIAILAFLSDSVLEVYVPADNPLAGILSEEHPY